MKIYFKIPMLVFVCIFICLLTISCSSTKILSLNSVPSGQKRIIGLDEYATSGNHQNFPQVKREVKIVFFHGMGWTEKDTDLAVDFTDGILDYYAPDSEAKTTFSIAGQCSSDQRKLITADGADDSGVKLRFDAPALYETDLIDLLLGSTRAGCIDRQIIEPENSDVRFITYRLFWDNAVWNSLQYYHVGWDDLLNDDELPEEFQVARQRKKINKDLKDQIVNHGFADATLYIGSAGENIRQVVETAICLAALDSVTGENSIFNQKYMTIDVEGQCNKPLTIEPTPVAFVAESLGSRALFDVLRQAHFNNSSKVLTDILRHKPEIFLLANQIPLLGLGNLNEVSAEKIPKTVNFPDYRAKLVAISEINDLLTYEIVPYLYQLNSIRNDTEQQYSEGSIVGPDENVSVLDTNKELAEEFGFDVVDVRMKFAKPLLNFIPIGSDPADAHTGHTKRSKIVRLMLCGAYEDSNSGKIIVNECKK